MMRAKTKRLAIRAEQIRVLRDAQLDDVAGGHPVETKKNSDCQGKTTDTCTIA